MAKAVAEGDRLLAVLAATGLTAIGAAFGAGEIFVRNGQPGASLAMAVLTGVALLCYVGTLALATAAPAGNAGPRQSTPARRRGPSQVRAAYPIAWHVTPTPLPGPGAGVRASRPVPT